MSRTSRIGCEVTDAFADKLKAAWEEGYKESQGSAYRFAHRGLALPDCCDYSISGEACTWLDHVELWINRKSKQKVLVSHLYKRMDTKGLVELLAFAGPRVEVEIGDCSWYYPGSAIRIEFRAG